MKTIGNVVAAGTAILLAVLAHPVKISAAQTSPGCAHIASGAWNGAFPQTTFSDEFDAGDQLQFSLLNTGSWDPSVPGSFKFSGVLADGKSGWLWSEYAYGLSTGPNGKPTFPAPTNVNVTASSAGTGTLTVQGSGVSNTGIKVTAKCTPGGR